MASNQISNGNQNGVQEEDNVEFDFDAILNIEGNQTRLGFEQGQNLQKTRFTVEGFNLGLSKGFEVGYEVAFYQAFAKTWLSHPKISDKQKKVLEQLLKLTQKFPEHNSKEEETSDIKVCCLKIFFINSAASFRDFLNYFRKIFNSILLVFF